MKFKELAAGEEYLFKSAKVFFEDKYEKNIKVSEPICDELSWAPAIQLKEHRHKMVVAEMSQTPYPEVFDLKYADILDVPIPIEIYCVCPDNVYHDKANQKEIKRLKNHGFGLVTVDENGVADLKYSGVPLVHHIRNSEFLDDIKGIPKKIKGRLKDIYAKYLNDSCSSIKEFRELFEEMVKSAVKSTVALGHLKPSVLKKSLANMLDEMTKIPYLKDYIGAISGVRGYISDFGNTSSHSPRSSAEAHTKFKECKQAFITGLRNTRNFSNAMKTRGIRISIR